MIDNSKEYIICAAIWYQDGTEAPSGLIAQNIDSGVVIGQWRHGNCINVRATNPLWNTKKLAERMNREVCEIPMTEEGPDIYTEVDGFLTSHGRFVDRWQAAKIALECGQLNEEQTLRGWERTDDDISDEELMNTQPHFRRGAERGRFRMIYSEDLY